MTSKWLPSDSSDLSFSAEQRFCGPGERHVRARQELPERPSWPSLTFHPLFAFHFVQAAKNKMQDLSTPSKQEVESILEAYCPVRSQRHSKTAFCGQTWPETDKATQAAFEQGDHRTVLRKWGTLQRAGDVRTQDLRPPETWDLETCYSCIRELCSLCFGCLAWSEVPAKTLVQAMQIQSDSVRHCKKVLMLHV